jgi:hypothetical protein
VALLCQGSGSRAFSTYDIGTETCSARGSRYIRLQKRCAFFSYERLFVIVAHSKHALGSDSHLSNLRTDPPERACLLSCVSRSCETLDGFQIPMTFRLAFTFVLLLCVGAFGLASTINQFAIVEAVNAKLPEREQFDSLWWGPSKTSRLRREYRRLYPEGKLLRRQSVLGGAMFVCIFLGALVLWLPF